MEEALPHIICPIRFVQDKAIFTDTSHLFMPRDDAEVVIVAEVELSGGRFDYILAQKHRVTGELLDLIALEVMACSTTSTGYVLKSFHDALHGAPSITKYGINYRQVLSRMMIQVLAKAYACEKWSIRMVWAIQEPLLAYMTATTKVELQPISLDEVEVAGRDFDILFYVYDLIPDAAGIQFDLVLQRAFGASRAGIERFLIPEIISEREEMLAHVDLPPIFHPTAVREIPSNKVLWLAKSAGVKCPSEL